MASVHYLVDGSPRFPKERVEVFTDGRVFVLDNFRRLTAKGCHGFRHRRLLRQDKGHARELSDFIARVTDGGDWLIPWREMEEVTLVTLQAAEMLAGSRSGMADIEPLGD